MNNQMNNGGAPKAEKIYDKGNVEIRKSKTSGNKAASAGDDEYVDFEEVKD
jgi:hypothetical protein